MTNDTKRLPDIALSQHHRLDVHGSIRPITASEPQNQACLIKHTSCWRCYLLAPHQTWPQQRREILVKLPGSFAHVRANTEIQDTAQLRLVVRSSVWQLRALVVQDHLVLLAPPVCENFHHTTLPAWWIHEHLPDASGNYYYRNTCQHIVT